MLDDLAPDARWRLAKALLRGGDYERGWKAYEARLEAAGFTPALPFPMWRGEALTGKRLVVWPEQGFGDRIMFARYFPMLKGAVTVLCEPRLVRLFRENFSVDVVEASGQVEFPDPDYWVMTCSLALHLGTAPNAPYIGAEPSRQGGIGVCTRGSPKLENDVNRSLTPEAAAQLLSLPGAVDLSPEATGAWDFADTARIIAGLDYVVSVDTSVAHLAGAMGKDVRILLPAVGTDWRWGMSGSRSEWYPSATLFRQRKAGEWAEVIEAATG